MLFSSFVLVVRPSGCLDLWVAWQRHYLVLWCKVVVPDHTFAPVLCIEDIRIQGEVSRALQHGVAIHHWRKELGAIKRNIYVAAPVRQGDAKHEAFQGSVRHGPTIEIESVDLPDL